MSMTRAEAIERLEKLIALYEMASTENKMIDYSGIIDTLKFSLAALRPASREQVEKVFSGCDFCKIELDDYPYIVAHSDYSSSDTCYEPSFCPICGKPLTDEAVDIIMRRLETLYETT